MQISGWEAEDEDIEEETSPHETPAKEILWAAENGKVDIVRNILLSQQNLVGVTDKEGYTPLHRASYSGHLDVIDVLIEYEANVHAETEMGWQPLHSACKWNHAKCAAKLLQNGADINAKSEGGQTPLHIAATHSNSKEVMSLLLFHPDIQPDLLNNSNETASQIAARCGKYHKLFELANRSINRIEY